MKRFVYALAALSLCAAAASAQNVPVQEVMLDNGLRVLMVPRKGDPNIAAGWIARVGRSEEHTSELQSRQYLVCRLLLETKKRPSSYTRAPIPSLSRSCLTCYLSTFSVLGRGLLASHREDVPH